MGIRELTLRGVILGGLITLLFTAANVYLGLRLGLTFATSIPAAVISMAVLRYFQGATIQENNIVQTIASAAGTLSAIIFVLPGLVMVGWWTGFPFWLSVAVIAIGGILGVMYSVPLRRALVTGSDLPYPEGVAAAEVLKVGAGVGGAEENKRGLAAIVISSLVAAAYAILAQTRILAADAAKTFKFGAGATSVSTSLSMALIGVGHLVGLGRRHCHAGRYDPQLVRARSLAIRPRRCSVRRGCRSGCRYRFPRKGPIHRGRHHRRGRDLDAPQDHRPDHQGHHERHRRQSRTPRRSGRRTCADRA
jgi:uncharacterized oligopeptide transporter (OPT) family protein